jgi:hypothetical protein
VGDVESLALGNLDTIPAGARTADKVVVFAGYPEFVELRDHILEADF